MAVGREFVSGGVTSHCQINRTERKRDALKIGVSSR